jgi:hypothetical protein
MKIEIKNYRGIASASLELANIALVCGPNGAGKSSIAEAVAACVTRNPVPLTGLKKKDASMLLRDDQKRGTCTVGDDTGSVTANWPGGSITSQDIGPQATPVAAGLESLVDYSPVNRAEHLIHYMKALPTEEDLRSALPRTPADTVSAVWTVILEHGWDAAHDRSKERGAKMKGAWEQITGENYGGAKANGWIHPLLTSWADVTLEDLQDAAADAKATNEKAIANRGTAQMVLDAMKEKVRIGEVSGPFIESLGAELEELQAKSRALEDVIVNLPAPETQQAYVECPHCKGHLVVMSRTVVNKPQEGGVSDEENQKRQQAISDKQTELAGLDAQRDELTQALAVYRKQQADGIKAAADLEKQPKGNATHQEQVESAQLAASTAKDLQDFINAHDATDRAGAMQLQILDNVNILEQLAPQGLRQAVLTRKMVEFNGMLARMCKVAGWASVVVADDLSITFGSRPLILCSKGEQYRVRAILQLAVADLDGSDMVIFDGADVLDRFGRNGLFKILVEAKIKALVCMTIDGQDKVPNIKAAGFGLAYWINDSVLSPV